MASISKRGAGWILRYIDQRGERKTITLYTESERQATAAKLKIENLLSAIQTGTTPDPETAAWLAKQQADKSKFARRLLPRLVAAGLIDGQRGETATESGQDVQKAETPDVLTLGKAVQDYIDRRIDVTPQTRDIWHQPQQNLVAFFGTDRPLADISVADAKDFERYLKTSARIVRYGDASKTDGLADATRKKRVQFAKQFFQDARDRRLIAENPFAGLKVGTPANKDRQFFVTLDMAETVLKACPDVEWKLIFALCRFGGLRCPSEVFGLRLEDIRWDENRFLVHSPKTKRQGKPSRWVPIFPELRPFLTAAWDEIVEQAEPGQKFLVHRYRNRSKEYLRRRLKQIIEHAGLTPWPKVFQNLRSGRQTELEDSGFPTHVVCAWLGNSPQVARKHYLQVTDDHFARATAAPARSNFVATVADNIPHYAAQAPLAPAKPSINRRVSQDNEQFPVRAGFHQDLTGV